MLPSSASVPGVIEAWEHIGNRLKAGCPSLKPTSTTRPRYQMLRWLKLYLRAEARGILGELLDPRDAGHLGTWVLRPFDLHHAVRRAVWKASVLCPGRVVREGQKPHPIL